MSAQNLRWLTAAILAFHAIGHFTGILAALQVFNVKGWNGESWLLTPLVGDAAARIVSIVLFAVILIGFLVVVLALLAWGVPYAWWRPLAIVMACLSLVTVALYWNAFVLFFPNKLGAIGVNIAVIVCLLVLNWPTDAALGYQ